MITKIEFINRLDMNIPQSMNVYKEWCSENCKKDWWVINYSNNTCYRADFIDPEDAMMFKLRWS